jgi:hypothetical protein
MWDHSVEGPHSSAVHKDNCKYIRNIRANYEQQESRDRVNFPPSYIISIYLSDTGKVELSKTSRPTINW